MVEQTKIRTGIQFERGSTTIFMTLFLTFVVVGGIQIYTQFYAPMEQNARLAAADGSFAQNSDEPGTKLLPVALTNAPNGIPGDLDLKAQELRDHLIASGHPLPDSVCFDRYRVTFPAGCSAPPVLALDATDPTNPSCLGPFVDCFDPTKVAIDPETMCPVTIYFCGYSLTSGNVIKIIYPEKVQTVSVGGSSSGGTSSGGTSSSGGASSGGTASGGSAGGTPSTTVGSTSEAKAGSGETSAGSTSGETTSGVSTSETTTTIGELPTSGSESISSEATTISTSYF
ncbi:MAG: hypothetical protein KDD44_04880 [Bdellovibrionales bacterium]|nr:hypothetical protein [Bdellovibrionales bacterium]